MATRIVENPQQTSVETPNATTDSRPNQQRSETATTGATEIEEVEGGFVLLDPSDVDKEVSSMQSEAFEEDQVLTMEEAGFDGTIDEAPPMDALFASYSELLPMATEAAEVIIGPDNRVRIFNTAVYPWRAVCALKITAHDNSRWIGTGFLISPRTVITAGHCVYMHDHGGWAKSIEVIPGLNDAARPFKSGVSSNLRSVKGWTQSKNRNYDYGAIILPQSYRPGATTGVFGFGVKSDAYLRNSVLNLSGYPGDKGGNQQWFMALRTKSVSSRVITYDIDTFGGQSGAPVWIKVGNTRTVVGVHTNGASSGNSATRIVLPVFNNLQAWKNLGA